MKPIKGINTAVGGTYQNVISGTKMVTTVVTGSRKAVAQGILRVGIAIGIFWGLIGLAALIS